MGKVSTLLSALMLTMLVLAGCQSESGGEETASKQEEKQEVTLQIELSKNKGEKVISTKDVTVEEGTMLMDVMKNNFEVEENEGFITGIEGITATDEKAWLFTINGESAMVGANEYEVKQGDEIVFDFHAWE
ncbi:DUF4430 domain-containing protein [Halobacillus shinanisalinarum]|uniref:DUF4430 domain-containing protein n=1 Tax=Halobacillus shinanisalinarum TaxID=2932258 RepID=A0ABY4H135_9BACI|nr:DUF4430 domain-containing protein [Halobacillus shinanisalinarum]UOQ93620.1 DUF4430 domain-containing protein [Halobacillus shinanisalinarum]